MPPYDDPYFDPDYPDKQFRSLCLTLDVPFVAGKQHLSLRDYKAIDAHWNAQGHQRIAALLERLYYRHMVERQSA